MGLLNRFKKKPETKKKSDLARSKKEAEKRRKIEAEEKKKKMFQAVPGIGKTAAPQGKAATPDKPKELSTKKKVVKEDTGDAYKTLLKPIVTEKMTALLANNQYGFMVRKNANKIEIRQAISQVYGVTPVQVRVIRVKGKLVKTGRVSGRTKEWKKAMVTLRPGEKIEIYESVKG